MTLRYMYNLNYACTNNSMYKCNLITKSLMKIVHEMVPDTLQIKTPKNLLCSYSYAQHMSIVESITHSWFSVGRHGVV